MDTSNGMAIFMQVLFEREIQFFKDYLETLEDFLVTEAQRLAQSLETLDLGYEPLLEERDGGRDEDDYGAEHGHYYEPSPREVAERFLDRLSEISGFVNLLRRSFFVSLYSFFDSRLMNASLERAAQISGVVWRKNGNDLNKFQKYFEEVLHVNFQVRRLNGRRLRTTDSYGTASYIIAAH